MFLSTAPGLESILASEAREAGFSVRGHLSGGVEIEGSLHDMWRANLVLRGASRVLLRLGEFRAMHLAQLDKRARKFPWSNFLRPDVPLRVEATCRKSRIYHAGAAAERIERAIQETLGADIRSDASLRVITRIDDDLCTFSVDTSGEPLHKRGNKLAVGKAPMRETLAALFLRDCGYTGTEPVIDPMCGSGTFVLEAAEMAAELAPGRARRFSFADLPGFDESAWDAMRSAIRERRPPMQFYGYDRDDGAIRNSRENAERAGLAGWTSFERQAIGALHPPDGPSGLVIVNPPYGGRVGNRKLLHALYNSLGQILMERFAGWRVGVITSEAGLAHATGLPFLPPGPYVPHGGLKIRLYKTEVLK
jgi:putative N6-adenine-specific DNA methylase